MSPTPRRVVTDHSSQVTRNFQLQPGRDRRDLGRDVIGIVEHGSEVADLRSDGLLRDHMPLIPPTEERHIPLELSQQSHELLGQDGHALLVALRPLVRLADGEAVLRVIVPPPEDVVPERLDDQALQQRGVLSTRPEEPGAECFTRIDGHTRLRCLRLRTFSLGAMRARHNAHPDDHATPGFCTINAVTIPYMPWSDSAW